MNSSFSPELNAQYTILVVDDNPTNLGVISDYLHNLGFNIFVAQDGESALEKAHYARPDLILLDVRMPGIDGFETCRRLKAEPLTEEIPVIFMTALAETDNKVIGFNAGGVDYITKPLQLEEVGIRVKTHLGIHAMRRQLEAQNVRLQQEIAERNQAEAALRAAHSELELRVQQRTAQLAQANFNLKAEITERKRIETEIQQRNRELTLLNRIIAASVTETKTEAILGIACRELAATFEVPQAAAALFNDKKNQAVVVAEYLAAGRPSALQQAIPIEGNLSIQQIIATKAPLYIANAQTDPRTTFVHELMCRRGTVSLLIVPILTIEGDVIGTLGLDALEPRDFSAEDINLAWRVADQVSSVLARLKLDEERQRLEAQYYQSQKMEAIGRLTGGVAHDFNNLLTVIVGYSELALGRVDGVDPLHWDIQQILLAGERAAGLTRQLLAFSRQQVLQLVILNLNEVVNNINSMLQRLIGEDIDFITILEPNLGYIKADSGQIEQIIMNLVINARDAMPDGGQLTIETQNAYLDDLYTRRYVNLKTGPYILLAVSDTGVGMDAETQAHIFEPFYTTKPQNKGTGLGLATVYGIINQYNGHIVVSSNPGHGTTFKIYLPQNNTTIEQIDLAPVVTRIKQETETVLLVEDDDMLRELAKTTLLDSGYTVLKAANGEEARHMCETYLGPIHLMLTDVVIPGGVNGPQLAQEISLLYPDIKILYMSGYTDNALIHRGVLDKGIAFLPKPFIPTQLLRKVREVLDAA